MVVAGIEPWWDGPGNGAEWIAAVAGVLAFLASGAALGIALQANRLSKEAIDLTRNAIPVFIVTVQEKGVQPLVYRIRNVGTGSAFGFWISGITDAKRWDGDTRWEFVEMERGMYLDFSVAPGVVAVHVADLYHGERDVSLPPTAGTLPAPQQGVVYELEDGLPSRGAFTPPKPPRSKGWWRGN